MRVLVVGQGGREHAICWKLKQSPLVDELFAAPGNGGITEIADCVPIGVADVVELADFAEKLKIDLTVVGPELPLTLGIVDEFQKRDMPIFGPTRLAAEIEGSKVFSKEFMRKYEIPTAGFKVCVGPEDARQHLSERGFPAVIKVEGLAGGKGVLIANSEEEADEYIRLIFEDRKFGNAGNRIVIEDFLEGEEVSFMVFTDGKRLVPLAPSKDYKKAFDGDEGPNSGGMGAHSPAIVLPGDTAAEIMKRIMLPTVQGMAEENRHYSGCLYAGIMLTPGGPKVLEYNCRLGDPETQAQLLRLESDLADVFMKIAKGNLGETKLQWKKEASACVVVAMDGYPGDVAKGSEIAIDAPDDPSVVYFHSGTEKKDGKLVSSAGRVITAAAHGETMGKTLKKVYEAAARVKFEGARYRKDIGYRALERRKQSD
ncbi:MAG: phosphoribosylamine--glycine ligase [Thermoanaerobaculia bacterium]|nr:phosphoribosylamine--glycine ligase [Thermoanaerobaculia bacterium]